MVLSVPVSGLGRVLFRMTRTITRFGLTIIDLFPTRFFFYYCLSKTCDSPGYIKEDLF